MIGVMCIIGGGVLEKFPKLRVAFLEAGAGWVPFWMERLDEHYEYMQAAVPLLTMPPSEYIRQRDVFFSFEPDETTLPYVMDFIGDDRLVFASDYNHGDCKFPNVVKRGAGPGTTIAAGSLPKIMGENARRLYNLAAELRPDGTLDYRDQARRRQAMIPKTIDSDAHVIEIPFTWEFMTEAERRYAPFSVAQDGGTEYWVVGQPAASQEQQQHRRQHLRRPARVCATSTPGSSTWTSWRWTCRCSTPTFDAAPLHPEPAHRAGHVQELQPLAGRSLEEGPGPAAVGGHASPALHGRAAGRAVLRQGQRRLRHLHARGRVRETPEPSRPVPAVRDRHGAGPPHLHPRRHQQQRHPRPLRGRGGFSRASSCRWWGRFHSLLMDGTPALFPKLRWGFVEVSAQWVPYALNDLRLRLQKLGRPIPDNIMAENRMYVACQTTDDLPVILKDAGEDNLVIGTDYGHNDTSSQIEALRMLRSDGAVPAGIVDKILGDNARALYGL